MKRHCLSQALYVFVFVQCSSRSRSACPESYIRIRIYISPAGSAPSEARPLHLTVQFRKFVNVYMSIQSSSSFKPLLHLLIPRWLSIHPPELPTLPSPPLAISPNAHQSLHAIRPNRIQQLLLIDLF